jgi:hypothetical protein
MQWIKPPWQSRPDDADPEDPGEWPWVGNRFLAAVRIRPNSKPVWSIAVVELTEGSNLLLDCGCSWELSAGDVEWIARIPQPEEP